MDYYQIIANNFQNTIEAISLCADDLALKIEQGSQLMTQALLADRKIIACGNGVDAALAQMFNCYLLDRFDTDRPALPALCLGADHACLTAITQSAGSNDGFSRQLRALGQAGDVLLGISSQSAAPSLLRAIQTAQERNMAVIVLSNALDKAPGNLLRPEDVELSIDAASRARVVELQTMTIHNFCDLIDHNLFGTHHGD